MCKSAIFEVVYDHECGLVPSCDVADAEILALKVHHKLCRAVDVPQLSSELVFTCSVLSWGLISPSCMRCGILMLSLPSSVLTQAHSVKTIRHTAVGAASYNKPSSYCYTLSTCLRRFDLSYVHWGVPTSSYALKLTEVSPMFVGCGNRQQGA